MSEGMVGQSSAESSSVIAEWDQFFRARGEFVAPVDQQLLASRLKGNQAGLLLTSIAIIIFVAGSVDALHDGRNAGGSLIVVGALVAFLALVLRWLWTTRQRLQIAKASPNYLTISPKGVHIADVVVVLWTQSIGVVVLTGRANDGSAKQRLGSSAARATGVTQTEVIIGLGPGVARPLRTAAGKRLRRLFEIIGENGALRVPLDSVLSPIAVAQVIAAMQSAPRLAGVGVVGPEDLASAVQAVQHLYLGKPILASGRMNLSSEMTDAAVPAAATVAAAAAASSISSAYASAAALFGRALAAASPAGLAIKRVEVAAAPSDDGLPIEELANAVLGSAGRRLFDDARSYLAAHGPAKFAARFPDLDDGFSESGPTSIQMLLGAGQTRDSRTIGWCDSSGEDEPGQVLGFIEQSCRTLWQSVPFWPSAGVAGGGSTGSDSTGSDSTGKEAVTALLGRADDGLSRNGQRLLIIDNGSDMHFFVPLRREAFESLLGRAGQGFRLLEVAELSDEIER